MRGLKPVPAEPYFALAQVPHFHALRFVNAIATVSTISFSIIAVGLSIYDGARLPLLCRSIVLLVHKQIFLRVLLPALLQFPGMPHPRIICALWGLVGAVHARACAHSMRAATSGGGALLADDFQCGACTAAGTHGLQGSPPDYSIASDPQTLLWDIFNGLGIMAFAYGNTVLPGACLHRP